MRRALIALMIAVSAGCSSQPDGAQLSAPSGTLKIYGPFVHEHLSLYVVEDPSSKSAGDFITLAEGLAAGTVKVSEKKNAQVNELMIENASDKPCFVQAGDVVKGGQQDRSIARDFVIPAKTAPAPIASFCVEHSRWNGKAAFEASTQNAYGRELKLAVQGKSDQGEVWKEVAKNKKQLADNNQLGAAKTSSLNEELESSKIQDRMKAFKAALAGILEGRAHAVGLVAAVNGKFTTSDVYADPGLFHKVFPRLLESATLEALATKAETAAAPTDVQAAAFLVEAEKGSSSTEKIREGLEANTVDNPKSVQFDYRWKNESLHRQTLSK